MLVGWLIYWMKSSLWKSCNQVTFSFHESLFISSFSQIDICASQTFSSNPGNAPSTGKEMGEQISPSSVQPPMTQQQPLPKGEAMQGWRGWERRQALKYSSGSLHRWRRLFQSLFFCFFFPHFPKPPQTWLTSRIILASSSAAQTAPPWRRSSLSGEIRAVRRHDGVQWHTELSRAEAEEYEIQNGALLAV